MSKSEMGDDDLFSDDETHGENGEQVLATPGNSPFNSQDSLKLVLPMTQKELGRELREDLKLGEVDDENSEEEEETRKNEVGFWNSIEAKEERVKSLKEEKKRVQLEAEEAMKTLWERETRLENKKEIILKQQATLFKQQEALKKSQEYKMCEEESPNLDMKIRQTKENLIEFEMNAMRLIQGKAAAESPKTETFIKVKEMGGKIAVFYPGSDVIKKQRRDVRDDLRKINNLKIIDCGESEMGKMATMIKNYEVTDGKEIGVCFVPWGKLAQTDEEEVLEAEESKFIKIAKLATDRGGEKFNKFFLIFPPVANNKREALNGITTKIKEMVEPEIETVNMAGEEIPGSIRYVFCRGLSEVVNVMRPEEGNKICEVCGLLHEECMGLEGDDEEAT